MLKQSFQQIEKEFSGQLEYDCPRGKYAYYRIGGPASVIASPKSFSDLSLIHQIIQQTKASYFILGWGSNLLFSDEAYEGVVIRMKHLFTGIEEMNEWNGQAGNYLKLGASLGASSLLKRASEVGYGGLDRLTGIPGSVGGMVAMNAGTHIGEIGPICVQSEYVTLDEAAPLLVKSHTHREGDFTYRHNHFLKVGDLLTHTILKYEPEAAESVKQKIDELYQRRKNSQPVTLPSCGSVFMNPRESGKHAWQVLDQLGLRGHQIGQAQISEKHSNFIVNLGNAKATDVKALIDLAKERAQKEMGIALKEEVKFIP